MGSAQVSLTKRLLLLQLELLWVQIPLGNIDVHPVGVCCGSRCCLLASATDAVLILASEGIETARGIAQDEEDLYERLG